jgi:hypothetical protein
VRAITTTKEDSIRIDPPRGGSQKKGPFLGCYRWREEYDCSEVEMRSGPPSELLSGPTIERTPDNFLFLADLFAHDGDEGQALPVVQG